MQTVLLLLVALVAGYLGGYLASARTQEQDKAELLGAVDELLSEIAFTAEEGCQRLVDERRKLELLLGTVTKKCVASVPDSPAMINPEVYFEHTTVDAIPQPWSQVVPLAEQGKSCTEIAKELNMGQGEVDLVLNLIRQKNDE